MRWLPGMLSTDGMRVLVVDEDGMPAEWAGVAPTRALHQVVNGHGLPGWCADMWDARRPDLADAATIACMALMEVRR